jgi:hypothetical protein
MKKGVKALTFLFLGLIFIGTAIFAATLGLDSNTNWGANRAILLMLGLFLTLYAILSYLQIVKVIEAEHRIQAFIEKPSCYFPNTKKSGYYLSFKAAPELSFHTPHRISRDPDLYLAGW